MSGATHAQSSKRIEQLDPALGRIISLTEPIHDLADGFGGSHGPARDRSGGKKAATCCSVTSITTSA